MNYHTLQALATRDNRRRTLWLACEYVLGLLALAGGFTAVYALAAILTVLVAGY